MSRSLSSVPKGSSISLAISSRPIYLGEGGGRQCVCVCVCVCVRVCVEGEEEGRKKWKKEEERKGKGGIVHLSFLYEYIADT